MGSELALPLRSGYLLVLITEDSNGEHHPTMGIEQSLLYCQLVDLSSS